MCEFSRGSRSRAGFARAALTLTRLGDPMGGGFFLLIGLDEDREADDTLTYISGESGSCWRIKTSAELFINDPFCLLLELFP